MARESGLNKMDPAVVHSLAFGATVQSSLTVPSVMATVWNEGRSRAECRSGQSLIRISLLL